MKNIVITPARCALRLTRVALHVARGMWIVGVILPNRNRIQAAEHIQHWSRRMLALLGVRVDVSGIAPSSSDSGVLMVANHVSWLDILVINSITVARFVAKSEVRGWPLIGWMCERAGAIFIERNRPLRSNRVNHDIECAFKAGFVCVVFPEGTTTDGSRVLMFRPLLMRAALRGRARLQPLALRYAATDGTPCRQATYHGAQSFLASLVRVACQPVIRARVQFLPAPNCVGVPHRAVAAAVTEQIALALGVTVCCDAR